MASTRQFFLHDNLLGGVETSLPAHLLQAGQWRTQHNFRNTPGLEQVARKKTYSTIGSSTIVNIGTLPTSTPGYGRVVMLSNIELRDLQDNVIGGTFAADATYRKWATAIYDSKMYFTNELNQLRYTDGYTTTLLDAAPKARYLCFYYDHAVVGYPTIGGATFPNQVRLSALYNFADWTPRATPTSTQKANEADFYDFVEWQQLDFPYVGVTGIGKLKGTLYVYTPTAIIPLRYVGLPKVIQVMDDGIITRTGNTFPWTLVVMGNVHFFFDAIESMFFAFDGQEVVPIGDPVKQYLTDNISTDLTLAQRMYGYVDADNCEVWWPFVSTESDGPFDKAVVFNYRYKKWFTANVEDVHSFCLQVRHAGTFDDLTGSFDNLLGTFDELGIDNASSPRIYGSANGLVMRDELASDLPETFVLFGDTYSFPVLETPDFHYGDLLTIKENDVMILNMMQPTLTPSLLSGAFVEDVGVIVDPDAGTVEIVPDGTLDSVTYHKYVYFIDSSFFYSWTPNVSVPWAYILEVNGTTYITQQTDIHVTAPVFEYIQTADPILHLYRTFPLRVQVHAFGRDFLGTDITWNNVTVANEDTAVGTGWPNTTYQGIWTPILQDAKLDYRGAVTGRILRYRFVFTGARKVKMAAYSDLVRGKLPEK